MEKELQELLEKEKKQLKEVEGGIVKMIETGRDLVELADGSKDTKQMISARENRIKQLDNSIREMIVLYETLSKHVKLLDTAIINLRAQKRNQSSEDENEEEEYDEGQDEKAGNGESGNKSMRGREDAADVFQREIEEPMKLVVEQHRWYREFCVKVLGKDLPAPVSGEGEGEEEEIQMGVGGAGAARSLICPLTRSELVKPMKNLNCGHVYSHGALVEYMKKTRKAAGQSVRCPVAGCEQEIQVSNLIEDTETEREIERAHRRVELLGLSASQQVNAQGSDYTQL